jgi:hypothetical protein
MEWKVLINELIQMVQSLAPELWRIARDQAKADLFYHGIWAVALSVIFTCIILLVIRAWEDMVEKYEDENQVPHYDPEVVITGGIVCGLFCLPLLTHMWAQTVRMAMSLDYYAIEALVELVVK